jgi:hypothetical protein
MSISVGNAPVAGVACCASGEGWIAPITIKTYLRTIQDPERAARLNRSHPDPKASSFVSGRQLRMSSLILHANLARSDTVGLERSEKEGRP